MTLRRLCKLTDLLAEQLELSRFSLGLRRTGLLFELERASAFVVLAPDDDAFDALDCSFGELIHDPAWVDARFSLFEGLVAILPAAKARGSFRSVAGAPLTIDTKVVRTGAGIVTRVRSVTPVRRGHVVHVDTLPIFPELDRRTRATA